MFLHNENNNKKKNENGDYGGNLVTILSVVSFFRSLVLLAMQRCRVVKCSICYRKVCISVALASHIYMVRDIKIFITPYDRGMVLVSWCQMLQF